MIKGSIELLVKWDTLDNLQVRDNLKYVEYIALSLRNWFIQLPVKIDLAFDNM